MRKFVSISCLLLLGSLWATAAQAQQPVDFKVDLTGSNVVLTSDADNTSLRNWSLPPAKLDEILRSSQRSQDDFRLPKRDEYSEFQDYPNLADSLADSSFANSSNLRDPLASRRGREMSWQRQRMADRVADSIYPGFGRVETQHANGATSRLDYIYTRRCGVKGLGICWQYRF